MRIKHVLMVMGLAVTMVMLGLVVTHPAQELEATEFNCNTLNGCGGHNTCKARYVSPSGCSFTCFDDANGDDILEDAGSVTCPAKSGRNAGIGGGHWGCFTPDWYCGSNGECI
jgi:hypothetical protein